MVGVESILNPITKRLCHSKQAMHKTLVHHYSTLFSKDHASEGRGDAGSWPCWFAGAMQPLHIPGGTYDGLSDTVEMEELVCYLKSKRYRTAPGDDRVSVGLLKVVCQCDMGAGPSPAQFVLDMVNALYHVGTPPELNTLLITPLFKKKDKPKATDNLRPISLQRAIAKTVSALLAARLRDVWDASGILSDSHLAFCNRGSSIRCVTRVFDVIEESNRLSAAAHLVLFDVKACYDLIPHWLIPHALKRVGLPEQVIHVIQSRFASCKARIRTAFGLSTCFPIDRGLPQGDPLGPLLCNVIFDAMHCGFRRNPLYHHALLPGDLPLPIAIQVAQGGPPPEGGDRVPFAGLEHMADPHLTATVSLFLWSVGYADDFIVAALTALGARRHMLWALAFLHFLGMEIAVAKSCYIGLAGGDALESAPLAFGDISLQPVTANTVITHMGIRFRVSPTVDFSPQVSHIGSIIGLFRALAAQNHIPASQMRFFLN